jgi:hypothetical protein
MAKKKPARKPTKKPVKKSGQKPVKKPVKKSAAPASKSASKKPGKATNAPGIFDVTTGTGANPLQVGQTLVKMFNEGKFQEIEDLYWDASIESIEGFGVNKGWRGRAAVGEKNAQWMADHVLHGAAAEGPFVGSSGFAVRYTMDVETRSTGARETMHEVGVYTVRDGKIVREEFMYLIPAQG